MRPEQRWGIGIGLRYAHFPFAVPDQSATDLVPLLFYEGERVFLRGMEGGVGLFGNARWRLNAYMRYRFPDGPSTADEVLDAVLEALADESARILDEGVVPEAADIDTCMILGGGWPFWLGGITKFLDQTGVSERVAGRTLGPAPVHATA